MGVISLLSVLAAFSVAVASKSAEARLESTKRSGHPYCHYLTQLRVSQDLFDVEAVPASMLSPFLYVYVRGVDFIIHGRERMTNDIEVVRRQADKLRAGLLKGAIGSEVERILSTTNKTWSDEEVGIVVKALNRNREENGKKRRPLWFWTYSKDGTKFERGLLCDSKDLGKALEINFLLKDNGEVSWLIPKKKGRSVKCSEEYGAYISSFPKVLGLNTAVPVADVAVSTPTQFPRQGPAVGRPPSVDEEVAPLQSVPSNEGFGLPEDDWRFDPDDEEFGPLSTDRWQSVSSAPDSLAGFKEHKRQVRPKNFFIRILAKGDGACLFHSLAAGKEYVESDHGTLPDPRTNDEAALLLRGQLLERMKDDPNKVKHFFDNDVNKLNTHLQQMADNPQEWGEDAEIAAAADFFRRPIWVWVVDEKFLDHSKYYYSEREVGEKYSGKEAIHLLWRGRHFDLLVPVFSQVLHHTG